ncbi:MAG: hypothetical protein L0H59_02780 [Tomitella sp.]|nr:hypothetical protein [Tomitella sp.]
MVSRPYLRVLAGFFAAIFLLGTVSIAVDGDFGGAVASAVFAIALGAYAAVSPLRTRMRRDRAEQQAVAARADAAHQAYLAGDYGQALAPPPAPVPRQPVRKGVLVASAVAAFFVVIAVIGTIVGPGEETSAGTTAPSATAPADAS